MAKNEISLRDFKSAEERRNFLAKETKANLEAISTHSFNESEVNGRNIENLIGSTHIPLGIAGPLTIRLSPQREAQGPHAEGPVRETVSLQSTKHYHIPLATTEGALVASISRGCRGISEAGGAIVAINNVGITRGPVFKTKSIIHSQNTQLLIAKNFTKLQLVAKKTSSHLALTKIETSFVGKNLYCRFYFSTADAMGMNMATYASADICRAIEKFTGATLIALAGNYDVDKKPAWLNFISGRGKQAWAEVTISEKLTREIFKTTPAKIVEVVQKKQHLGSIMSGSLGANAHFANVIAAMFIATGQDPAHIVEGSLGVTTAEVEKNGDLYFSVYLPALIVGTVGGGTNLPTQKEALSILTGGRTRPLNVLEFARVIAATVLAGELSLTASLAEGSLAQAHKKLARGRT